MVNALFLALFSHLHLEAEHDGNIILNTGFWLSEQVQKRRKCVSRGGFQSQNIWRVWFLIIIYITQGSDHIPHFSFWCKWNIQLEIDIIHSSVFIRDELQTLDHLLTLNPTGFRIHLMCVSSNQNQSLRLVLRLWFHEAVFTRIHSFDTNLLIWYTCRKIKMKQLSFIILYKHRHYDDHQNLLSLNFLKKRKQQL